jgi:hypothetical protein
MASIFPLAITSPPCIPAPGPRSTMYSAALIVSSSCSTTMTVFFLSLKFFNVFMSFLLSLGCKPILGSSNTYKTPVKPVHN